VFYYFVLELEFQRVANVIMHNNDKCTIKASAYTRVNGDTQ